MAVLASAPQPAKAVECPEVPGASGEHGGIPVPLCSAPPLPLGYFLAASITSLNPSTAGPGDPVVINGSGFYADAYVVVSGKDTAGKPWSATSSSYPSTIPPGTVWTLTQMEFIVPAQAVPGSTVSVVVYKNPRTAGKPIVSSNTATLSVGPSVPLITLLLPAAGTPGSSSGIIGYDVGTASNGYVTFSQNGTSWVSGGGPSGMPQLSLNGWAPTPGGDTQINFVVPQQAKPGQNASVTVTTRVAGRTSTTNAATFTVQYPAPEISALSPSAGVQPGTTITLQGNNLGSQSVGSLAFYDNNQSWASNAGATLQITSWSDSQISFVVPSAQLQLPSTATVTVHTPGGSSNAESIALAPTPAPVATLSPLTSTTISAVPPSIIFPPDSSKWYALMNVAGVTPGLASNGASVARIELRGWIRDISPNCNAADPDWHMDVELDPQWLDTLGLSLDAITPVGSVIASVNTFPGSGANPATWRNIVSTPELHVELNGWRSSRGPVPSSDWVSDPDPVNCPQVFWAFEPLHPFGENPPLAAGDYVRLVGSLITDEPHDGQGVIGTFACQTFGICADGAEERTVELDFSHGLSSFNAANPARWVEMHPPDLVARLPAQQRANTISAVELDASNCLAFSCSTETADFDIPAPAIMPDGSVPPASAMLQAQQMIIGVSTNFRTITSGPTITAFHDHVHVHVTTQGQTGWGANGKFVAIYRVHY